MTKDELLTMLGATASPVEIAQWLRADFLPMLATRFNQDDSRKRLGLYQGERIPDNERNLTDVRNRVSLIIEYELARVANDMLTEAGITELFWSYVVANRFPDLEIRRADGTRRLRVEVKCLQSIAEEKSANFDTLKKDINPTTDFVVVFVWEWGYGDSCAYSWDRSPRILQCYVFNAMALAELRDAYWLNRPPENLGNGFQGFDLRYGVNCTNGRYAEEEGNYGKLLRIWQADFAHRPQMTPVRQDTEAEYLRFRQEVILHGFWSLCNFHLPRLAQMANTPISRLVHAGEAVGAALGEFGFFTKTLINNGTQTALMQQYQLRYGVAMTEKYVCTGQVREGARLATVFNQKKPKHLSRQLFGLV